MDDMNKIKRTLPLPEGWAWGPHEANYNDPYQNFERIRTIKPNGPESMAPPRKTGPAKDPGVNRR